MSDTSAPGRIGLRIPAVFYGGEEASSGFTALRRMLEDIGDVTDPRNSWFVADNLLTYSHTRGFLTDPRFVKAVMAAQPRPAELALGV